MKLVNSVQEFQEIYFTSNFYYTKISKFGRSGCSYKNIFNIVIITQL